MELFITYQTYAIFAGFMLDFFLGDPPSFPHPVRLIGKLISYLDEKLRHGENDERDLKTGTLATGITVSVSTLVPLLLLILSARYLPYLYFFLCTLMCWQLISARQLQREADKVKKCLFEEDIEGARKAVSMIVGRDTEKLDEKGITRAAVETVAESTSDGVAAPLFWMMVFGPVGGFFYKSVNTLDSMIGYKNDKYIFFGRAAAKLDDAVNFIPSRLAAVLMIAASALLRLDAKNALKIFRRDRLMHASPNSAQTESVCAGALDLQLLGPATYGGILNDKPFVGDPIKEIEPKDIERACNLMYATSALMLALTLIIRTLVMLCF
ncbi:MAG: cobalamin biosynthesis protein CobD [Clostridia bacterium]|nr:cobalamin biosynthesis protein CobD [Clostridia bacterium]MBQ1895280.1 cobalamin biosynthesis protein CobD [Clostridia bacterium]MBQ2092615.1 cobalamin biosynthesis protein CobD [Clostridia bacterium]MBQ2500511.1 cobalamin biosynthesis protein CobD [Clostridia bacterium]MBQ3898012.1 cobalamin biosynthesis protein CobD [Clostridia bacterium]